LRFQLCTLFADRKTRDEIKLAPGKLACSINVKNILRGPQDI
jgi:hypothetical protein